MAIVLTPITFGGFNPPTFNPSTRVTANYTATAGRQYYFLYAVRGISGFPPTVALMSGPGADPWTKVVDAVIAGTTAILIYERTPTVTTIGNTSFGPDVAEGWDDAVWSLIEIQGGNQPGIRNLNVNALSVPATSNSHSQGTLDGPDNRMIGFCGITGAVAPTSPDTQIHNNVVNTVGMVSMWDPAGGATLTADHPLTDESTLVTWEQEVSGFTPGGAGGSMPILRRRRRA